jgi:choline dehydrogenase-like flavoprotein
VKGLSEEVLTPHWDSIEKRLHIAEWPLERMNSNNKVLWDGCGKLGYSRGLVRRNVNNCANLGYCGLGCPLDAKMSMLVTLIPDAVEKGMTVQANASVRRLLVANRRVDGVEAELLDPETDKPTGVTLTVKARTVAVCGGAINSPALLLRSGLDGNGNVGKRFFLHPVVIMSAVMPDPVYPWSGAPQSAYSHHFSERGPGKLGFLLEVPPIMPLIAASVFPGFGESHQALLETLPYTQSTIAICHDGLMADDVGGTIKLRDPKERRVSIDYPLRPFHFEAFKAACKEMARIQFAAGAREVRSLHALPIRIEKVADVESALDAAPWEPGRVRVATAHQMGGCAMGGDPRTSVVDSTLRYHGMDNLFVVDGSVFPTALGVNPQESIFGVARWASQFVAAATA